MRSPKKRVVDTFEQNEPSRRKGVEQSCVHRSLLNSNLESFLYGKSGLLGGGD